MASTSTEPAARPALNLDGTVSVADLAHALRLTLTFRGVVVNLDGVITVNELAAVVNVSVRTDAAKARAEAAPARAV
jgi:hypothetical protein